MACKFNSYLFFLPRPNSPIISVLIKFKEHDADFCAGSEPNFKSPPSRALKATAQNLAFLANLHVYDALSLYHLAKRDLR